MVPIQMVKRNHTLKSNSVHMMNHLNGIGLCECVNETGWQIAEAWMSQTYAFTCEQVNNVRACVRVRFYWTFRVELSNDTNTHTYEQHNNSSSSSLCVCEHIELNWIECAECEWIEATSVNFVDGGERIPCVCNRDKWRCWCEIWRNPYSQLTDSRSVLCCLLCISKRLIVMIVVFLSVRCRFDWLLFSFCPFECANIHF